MKKFLCVLFMFLLVGYNTKTTTINNQVLTSNNPVNKTSYLESNKITNIKQEVTPEEKIYEEISLVSAGDNLIHSMVIKSGIKDTYDYNYMYENIKDYINKFDIKVLNQETVLINDKNKCSGYPTFGSPIEIGEAVINTGFNVITQATNHAYDKKEEGITDSINFWEKNNIPILGIHNNPDDNVFIYETENTKIAMLNYTYSLNGFSLPDDKKYLVDSLYDNEKILNDLKYAKENADFVIVFPHWGVEYTHKETEEQIKIANMLAENGADLIIGAHPHVVEPVKIIKTSDNRKVPCYYSLGNFISNQDEIPRMLGALAEVKIINDNGNVYIKEYEITPIVTYIESYSKEFRVYLLSDYTEEINNTHRMKRIRNMSIDDINEIWNNIIENSEI